MKIWFDLSNSPHINMFHDLIRELESEGHEIIITSRPLGNTIQLLDKKGMKHTVVGEHYGKNLLKKLFGYPIRVWQLRKFLKPLRPDLAVSQSSFHSPLVAWLLGIPSIYTNDNEHAKGNIPSFLFATKILIPENLSIEKVVSLGGRRKKILQYPGVKEGIFLWNKGIKIQEKRKNNKPLLKKIYIRPEPQTAQYYNAKHNFLDEIILNLKDIHPVILLPREKNQVEHYSQKKFSNLTVAIKPIDFEEIAEECLIFIGAGGSMTRELAIIGVPTISVYQDALLDVDLYLLKKGLLIHSPQLTTNIITDYLHSLDNNNDDFELLAKGKQAYELFKKEILNYTKYD